MLLVTNKNQVYNSIIVSDSKLRVKIDISEFYKGPNGKSISLTCILSM